MTITVARGVASPVLALAVALGPASAAASEGKDPQPDLKALSLDQLVNLEVTTVSRQPERWWAAASGVDVITGDEIRRSGALTLPDAIRLAAGVQVGQSSARSWAVSIRGMNVLAANKVSVVMDGRSLFTPFFSGVLWDAQDTVLDDVDRIEVVRGPVGALWGAFAVNGVIQILTRSARDTQGLLVSAGMGTEDPAFFALRYGGRAGRDVTYRAYAKYFQQNWTYLASGERAQPATDFLQAGFRVDGGGSGDTAVTVQGDYYTNQDLPLDRDQTQIHGANVLGRWRRQQGEDADLQLEAYFDHTFRTIPLQFGEERSTGSASARYRHAHGRHGLLFGADALVSGDQISNIGIAQLVPGERTIHTFGLYGQDTWQFKPRAALVVGVKGERSSFSGFDVEPTLRVAYTPDAQTTAWAAVSRAVRTPVRIDEDLVIRFNGIDFFQANDAFETETAWCYEAGLRRRPAPALTFDLAAFAYRYDSIRSTEPVGEAPVPATFKNSLNARSWGAEASVAYQPLPRLYLKGSYRFLDLRFSTDPGSRHTTGGSAEGNDSKHVAVVRAHLTLPRDVELDAFVRHASAIPNPALDGYTTMDARLGWSPFGSLEVAVWGRNLLQRQRAEFVTTNSLNEQIHRSLAVKLTWRP